VVPAFELCWITSASCDAGRDSREQTNQPLSSARSTTPLQHITILILSKLPELHVGNKDLI
jgi:hypothetical protein